ncbi:MAG: helix-turn-helix transcriptional regulator [Actinomycetota bacterium]
MGDGGSGLSQPTQLLTTAEVAAILRVPTRTLEDWRGRGYGPVFLRVGKSVRYRVSKLEEWIAMMEEAES